MGLKSPVYDFFYLWSMDILVILEDGQRAALVLVNQRAIAFFVFLLRRIFTNDSFWKICKIDLPLNSQTSTKKQEKIREGLISGKHKNSSYKIGLFMLSNSLQ